MRVSLIVLLSILATASMSCVANAGPPLRSGGGETPAAKAPKPVLQAELPDPWIQDTSADTDRAFAMVLRQPQTGATAFVVLESPFRGIDPEKRAALLVEAVNAMDGSTSPIESGKRNGLAFAAFKTVEMTEQGLIAGAVIVRQLEGSPYLLIVMGKWPIEHAMAMLMDFQAIVSAITVEGHEPPLLPDDWLRDRGETAPR